MENEKKQQNIKFTKGELLLLHQLVYSEIKYNEFIDENTNRPISKYENKLYSNLFKKLDNILFNNLEI